ncbi:MAG: hypothetical protein ACE366_12450 [Bradymonadia bacterium]
MKRRSLILAALIVPTLLLSACGGGKSKGGDDDRTAYQKLEAIPGELDAKVKGLTSPIDSVDTMLAQIKEAPAKFKLNKDDFGKLLTDSLTGKPFQAPAGVDEKGAKELEGMLGNVKGFTTNLMNTPANATAMVGSLGEMLVEIPKLATQVTADTKVVKANPLASKEEKAKAEAQEKNVEKVKQDALNKVNESKEKVAGVPARATAAIAKFAGEMSNFGVTEAALGAVKDKGNDAKDAANEMKDAAEDNAKDAAKAATK